MSEPVILETVEAMRAWSRDTMRAGRSIGFVPTMGALHTGHTSLMERARKENNAVVVSIYVNPTQFGLGEDFDKYPRTLDADRKLCGAAGVDCIFAPKNLYEKDAMTFVEVGALQDHLCGISRPGHFRGVATVVTKLFNIVAPDRAYFGMKDAQQLLVIQTMVRDLNMSVEVVPCEIVREADGLAMSSRNRYLSERERKLALTIPRALDACRAAIKSGERDAMKVVGDMANLLAENDAVEIDYCAIVDAHTLEDVKNLKGDVLAAIAVKIGKTRLIDNAGFERL
ncbi:MAG: pantoate--beta-alanine ligase [Planctomycetota bacterium]